MKRLGIYFIYDKDGIVDDYIPYFLKHFKPFCNELCVVVNGYLTPKSEQLLRPFCTRLIKRKNEGFDAWAYKTALDAYGRDKLLSFDEIILTNFTLFGPFYPLDEMFNNMESSSGDLWGFFRWPNYNEQKQELYPHPLSSSFISYRRSVVQSEAFKQYWEHLPPICSYKDAVFLHEQYQQRYYEERGFSTSTWIDYRSYRKFWQTHWPLFSAKTLIEKEHFPFLKRRQFFIEDGHFTWGWDNLEIVKYLKKNSLYNVFFIYQNICRTQPINTLPVHNFNWRGFCYYFKSLFHFNPLKRLKAKRYLLTVKDFQQAFEKEQ